MEIPSFPIKHIAQIWGKRFKLSVATPNSTIQKHVYAKHSYLLNCKSPTIRDSLEIPIQSSTYYKHSKNVLLTGLKRKLSPTMYLYHCSNFPPLPPPLFFKTKKQKTYQLPSAEGLNTKPGIRKQRAVIPALFLFISVDDM